VTSDRWIEGANFLANILPKNYLLNKIVEKKLKLLFPKNKC